MSNYFFKLNFTSKLSTNDCLFYNFNFFEIMIEEPEPINDHNTVICQIPPNVNVYDMCFDWAGKKLAVACSDKTIRIYDKKPIGEWS